MDDASDHEESIVRADGDGSADDEPQRFAIAHTIESVAWQHATLTVRIHRLTPTPAPARDQRTDR